MNYAPPAVAHRLTSGAVAWLWRERENGQLRETAVDLDPDGGYKSLAEGAMAGAIVLREGVAGAEQQRAAQGVIDYAWEQFGRGDLLYERQLRHPLAIDPMEAYAHFVRAGLRHARLDDLLAHVHAMRLGTTMEMLPDRRLAVANAARLIGLPAQAEFADLAEVTWLGARTEPWIIDWITAYQMTHTVFHLTDWGGRPQDLPARLRDYLRMWLPVWLDVWLEIGQWDLAGELLVVDSCLPEPVCPESAWHRFAEVQAPDGSLPPEEAPAETYEERHHTTVVAAIAGTLGLSRRLTGAVAG